MLHPIHNQAGRDAGRRYAHPVARQSFHVIHLFLGRDDDNLGGWPLPVFSQPCGHFGAANARQGQVEQHQIGVNQVNHLQRLFAAVGGRDLVLAHRFGQQALDEPHFSEEEKQEIETCIEETQAMIDEAENVCFPGMY